MRGHNSGRMTHYDIALIQRPQSSAQRIVFPWDHLLKNYSKIDFNPVYLHGRLSEPEIDSFLQRLTQSKEFKIRCPVLFFIVPLIPIIGIVIFFILIFNTTRGSVIIYLIFPLSVLVSILLSCLAGIQMKNRVREKVKFVERCIQEENVKLAGKEVRWKSGPNCFYLLLDLEFAMAQLNNIALYNQFNGNGYYAQATPANAFTPQAYQTPQLQEINVGKL